MIVWLASYPRSGNTFLRVLLKRFFGVESYSVYNDKLDIGADEELSDVVGHHSLPDDWQVSYNEFAASPDPVFVKTHGPAIDDAKTIYLVRDPRAVAVSYARYLEEYADLKYSLRDVALGAVPFGGWANHVRAWNPTERENTLFVRFEDLIADPLKVVNDIGDMLGLEPKREELVKFDELKDIAPQFFRTGSNQKNRENLPDALTALIESVCADEMQALGYELCGPVDPSLALHALSSLSPSVWHHRRQLNVSHKVFNRTRTGYHKRLANVKGLLKSLRQEKKQQAKDFADKMDNLTKDQDELKTQLKQAQNRLRNATEKASAKTEETQKLREKLKSAVTRANGFQLKWQDSGAQIETLRQEISAGDQVIAEMATEKSHLEAEIGRQQKMLSEMRQKLVEYAQWTAPRLRSLATLRPMRLSLRQRGQIKRGEISLDEHGVFQPQGEAARATPTISSVHLPTEKKPNRGRTSEPSPNVSTSYPALQGQSKMGVAVFAFDRPDFLQSVLESLKMQEGLSNAHVWIDGDQGRPDKRLVLDKTAAIAESYQIAELHRNAGNFGFRKMIITALREMSQTYDRILVLEDDCFPTRHCLRGFEAELDKIENEDDIFSVYGHPFLVENEQERIGRFQGWGWATTSAKLSPMLDQLTECYLMTEKEYLSFIDDALTEEILAKIDVTPGRDPSKTLRRFFAWDETLGLLVARAGMWHRNSKERLIYNFGMGASSTHFREYPHFRQPPFNLIAPDEVWNYF